MMNTLFHLSFPLHDLEQAQFFYCNQLGCKLGRKSDNALIVQMGMNQLVGHKIESPLPLQEGIYPRHFGLIFLEKAEFDEFILQINSKGISYEIPLKIRFANTRLEHRSFFLKDPSNNLLEFKHYTYPSAIFGEETFHQIGEE